MKLNLRIQTLIAVSVTSAVLVAVLYGVLTRVVGQGFSAVEQAAATLEVQRAQEAYAQQIQTVCERGVDWAYWDDAYRYLGGEDPGFVESNLSTVNFSGLNVDFVLFLDRRGSLVANTGRTATGGTGKASQLLLDKHFFPGAPATSGLEKAEARSGVLLTPGLAPAMFCAFPVLTSAQTGPSRGVLVMGRYFDEQRRASLASQAHLDITFGVPGESEYGAFAGAVGRLADPASVWLEAASEDAMVGWARFPDFRKKANVVARIAMPRDVHQRARTSLGYLLAALIVYGIALAGITVALVESSVIRTLRRKASELFSATVQLSATAEQAAATAAQQATMVTEVGATVEELQETSRAAASNAETVLSATGSALSVTRDGEGAMAAALRVMDQIAEAVAIVDTVNNLTEQSNLLAVNASIEAARAGEQGRRFASVAVDVRNLAEQSRTATQRIRDAIKRTQQGRAAIGSAVQVVQRLSTVLEETTDRARQIFAATNQQAAGIQQINDAMTAVAAGGQDTAAGARQIKQVVGSLEDTGRELMAFVGREGAVDSPRRRGARA